MTKHLPLIALLTLGVAACGGGEVETEDDATVVTTEEDMGGDTMATDDSMSTSGTTYGTMEEGATVTVTINGVQPDAGEVYVALQTAQGFLKNEGEYTETATATGSTVTVNFDDVEPGSYAVAAFQDTDGNGELAMGTPTPTEPWGLSGYSGGRPDFNSAMIDVGEMGANATVSLQGGTM
ncbi:DUF2141 domain-containing protein [Parvularcula dongshanensis]|uniref:Uncharacterized protein (DUF2141 family) n=1 Tax=Parvularcula dongshanensis TaxID=1173995 RepID=A0A840I281_9PROT|nr:uncharacterized protein (DUF2141 family) [Parvularcula dongshanensis]